MTPESERHLDRSRVRIVGLHDCEPDTDLEGTTAADRIGMMWQLALDAWAFMGEPVAEPGLQRHIVRILRRER